MIFTIWDKIGLNPLSDLFRRNVIFKCLYINSYTKICKTYGILLILSPSVRTIEFIWTKLVPSNMWFGLICVYKTVMKNLTNQPLCRPSIPFTIIFLCNKDCFITSQNSLALLIVFKIIVYVRTFLQATVLSFTQSNWVTTFTLCKF